MEPVSWKTQKHRARKQRDLQSERSCVWTTLVMLGDSYACGAAVVARTLRNVGTKYPIWCMVTLDVSEECVAFLRTQFDNVVLVPLITQPCVRMRTAGQNARYGSWIASSFTKWNIWNRDLFPFDKVCLVDADMMFMANCDNLFCVDVPAATFSSPWVYPYIKNNLGEPTGSHNPYYDTLAGRGLTHGQLVDHRAIQRGFKDSILGFACMVVVRPDPKMYAAMIKLLTMTPLYGSSSCQSGFDEQLFASTILHTKTPVYHIHPRYNSIVGKPQWLEGHEPMTQQFYNGRPWDGIKKREDVDASNWDDVKLWWKIADGVITNDNAQWFYSS